MVGAIAAMKEIRHSRYYPALIFAVFACVLLLRCWPRLVSPQVWAEDGTVILHGLVSDGWLSFFEPCNGYWQLIGKLISATALGLSISQYPLSGAVLACLFSVSVGLAVALSPTLLRGRFFCALALFIVPTDPEVYGQALCAFWWAGILLFLLVLWDERHVSWGWRTGFLLIGGLSSPVILAVLPVLYWRAFFYRGAKAERWLALLATLIASLQIAHLASGAAPTQYASWLSSPPHVVPKFLGGFLVGNIGAGPMWAWLAGSAVIVGILLWVRHAASRGARWILLYLLASAVGLSVARVDPALLNTYEAAPRYFFYPFILLFWILIQLYNAKAGLLHKGLAVLVVALATLNMLPVLTRSHVDLEWLAHLRSCRLFPAYNIPVQVNGKQMWPGWAVKLKGEDCDKFLRRDPFVSMSRLETLPVFSYTVQPVSWALHETSPEVVANSMTGGDLPLSSLPGYRIVGSYSEDGEREGAVRLRLKRGASLLYRSGADKAGQSIRVEGYDEQFFDTVPATDDWVKLTFSNILLPVEFVVRIQDAGAGGGQWSAIALPAADPLPR